MTPRLPFHRGLELAAGYRESLISQNILGSIGDPITDEAFEEILKKQGILAAFVGMSDRVSAVYMRSEPCALVLINRQNTIGHQRFSLAHELCHHFYHRNLNTWVCSLANDANDMHEREANEFAAALLLPAKAVGDSFSVSMAETQDVRCAALRICAHYRASWQSTVYRLFNLHLILSNQRDTLLGLSVTSLAKELRVESDIFNTKSPIKMPSEFSELAERLRDRSIISDQKYASTIENLDALRECSKESAEVWR